VWAYSELHSCPIVATTGSFKWRSYNGWVALPLLNYRVTLLRRSDEWRVVSNASSLPGYEKSFKACRSITEGILYTGVIDVDLAINASFYGGIGSYINVDSAIRPVSIDLVDTRTFKFYLKPYENTIDKVSKGSLEDWILLQAGLREGWPRIVMEACEKIGLVKGEHCIIITDIGDLLITRKEVRVNDWVRVVPDNAPLRHVVNVDYNRV